MHELVEAMMAWPVIIQGALGSALFWLVLLLGQSLMVWLSRKYSHHSKQARISWITSRRAQLLANTSGSDAKFATYAVILLYRASRHLFKALMWLSMGLVFQSIFMPAGIVGFFGCIYYLLKGSAIVGVMQIAEDPAIELEIITKELVELTESV